MAKLFVIPDRQACARAWAQRSQRFSAPGHRPYDGCTRPGLSLTAELQQHGQSLQATASRSPLQATARLICGDRFIAMVGGSRQAIRNGSPVDQEVQLTRLSCVSGPAERSSPARFVAAKASFAAVEGMSPRRANSATPNTRSSPLDGGLPQGRRHSLRLRVLCSSAVRRRRRDAGTVTAMEAIAAAPRAGWRSRSSCSAGSRSRAR